MLDRRAFLQRAVALGLLSPLALQVTADSGQDAARDIDAAAWPVLAVVLAHLWPAQDGTPGADAIDAIGYLRATLDHPAADHAWRTRILGLAQALQEAALAGYGRDFAVLEADAREALLRGHEGKPGGQRVLAKLIDFLLEALLADPVYGGNREQRGWHWLQHTPGFPRPPAGKRWYQLAPAVERRPKAGG